MREFFMKTERIGFSKWNDEDLNLAKELGHHPENEASRKILTKLGFKYLEKKYYEPTGLYHPSYELINDRMKI